MKFFLLDKQQNIIGRLSEEYILEATFTEEINTAGELLITLPAKKRLSGNVVHVLITNPSKDHSYLMFKIIKETVKDEEVEYTAVESAYDELASYGYIQDKRPTADAQTITEMILKDTRWNVGEIPSTSETFISFYYLSVLDCLKKIVQTFGFEIGFDVLIDDDTNQITDRRVNFYLKQGEQTGKRFEYGSNLLSIKQEQDTQNIYTALVGRGKGAEVSNGNDNTPDGYGRRITFSDVEWSKENGDPLDKPKGQEWIEDPDATKQLGFSNGHMRIGLQVFEDVDDPKVLLQKTYEALKIAERPQVQFSASVINTGELHLGDRVGITRNDIGIAYETRVFKVQHNLLDETQNTIDLGDNLEETNSLSYQVSSLQSEITNHQETLITVTQSANGKNQVYYSPTTPATGSNGDVWYKDLGNGETEMYLYDNGWQLIISTENLHKIENEVKQQQTALDQAVKDASSASSKADSAVAQAGDANTNAQKAIATAEQNQEDLSLAKSQLSSVQTDLASTKSTLSGAVADITEAKVGLENTNQDLGIMESNLAGTHVQLASDEKQMSSLTAQAQQQGQTITDLQKTQSGLSADVADVKGNVSSLQATANGIKATVGTLNSENLISNSDCLTDTPGVAPNTDWTVAWGWQYSDGTLVGRANWYGQSALQLNRNISQNWAVYSEPVMSGKPNQDTNYAFSMGFMITIVTEYDVYLECGFSNEFKSVKDVKLGTLPTDKTGVWQEFQATCTVPSGYSWVRLKITSSIAQPYLWIAKPMLVYGTKQPTAYISSNEPSQKMSSISETIDGIKTSVADNKGNITSLQQTSQGLESDVANNKNGISSISQSVDSLKTAVQDNKGNISSLQQTANSLQGSIADNKNNIANIKVTAQGLQTSVEDNKKNISNVQQQAGIFESTLSTINSDNLVPNSDCLTNTPGVAPNTDWTVAWGWQYSDGSGAGRAWWYTYSALQLNQLSTTKYAFSQGVSVGNSSSSTNYAISVKYMLQNQSPEYHIYLQAGYDSTFKNCKDYDLGTANNFNGNNYCELTATVNVPSETPWIRLKVTSNSDGGYIWIAQPMIVYGTTVPTAYISSNQPSQKMSSIKQTIDSIESTVQGNSGQISQVKQTSDSLEATVSRIDVNNKNLFSMKKSTVQDNIVTSDFIPIIPGKTYILTIYNQGSGTNTFGKYFEEDKATSSDVSELPGNGNTQLNNGSVVIHVPDNQSLKYIQILIGLWDFNNISADQLQVSFTLGDSPVEYQPSVYDEVITTTQMKADLSGLTTLVNNNKGDISQLKQTSDSLTSQIGNANNDISSLKQRADSMETNISNNQNDISSLKQTAQSLQSNIQSKTDISQFTQLSNAFQTVVEDIGAFLPDSDFSDTDLSKYYDPWDTSTSLDPFKVITDDKQAGHYLQLHGISKTIQKIITKDYIRIIPTSDITYSGQSLLWWNDPLNGSFIAYLHFYNANKEELTGYACYYKYDQKSVWQDFSYTVTPPSDAMYLRIESTVDASNSSGDIYGGLRKLRLQNGDGFFSKISQLSDDINLRVQKGDLISQINIEAGKTLIQSKNLYLDSDTVTFSGRAFIPSAAITDLSADKITAGTLNAGNVNIINLDVNKLVGDTTEFVRSGWTNAYGSHVQIDGGGVNISYGNWYTRFDSSGVSFKDGGDYLGEVTRIGMDGAPSWYNGLAFNAGGDAEFLAFGAQDYGNDSQGRVPAKLLWMRGGIDTYGYRPGWNFCDKVWAGQVGMSSIQYQDWNIHFEEVTGNNGFSALALVSGSGNGFYWGSDGSFGYVTGHGGLHNVQGSQIIYGINKNGGTCESWSGVN